MGILRAVLSSADAVLQEQWREFFLCDALDAETLIVRGIKHVGERSVNTNPNDNIITNGSILSVADGQCVLVVSQGKVIDVCSEPGEHLFEDPSHPGGLNGFVKDVWMRVGFGGGDVQPIRHRIYYINTKESTGNRFGPGTFALAVRDEAIGADLDLTVEVSGVYSYRVADPAALYKQIVGNIERAYQRTALNTTVSALLLSVIPEALSSLTSSGIRPHQLPACTGALRDAVLARVQEPLLSRYGLEIVSLAFDPLTVTDLRTLQGAQQAAILRDPTMAAATMVDAVGQLGQNLRP